LSGFATRGRLEEMAAHARVRAIRYLFAGSFIAAIENS
jgi:hypothetical protein